MEIAFDKQRQTASQGLSSRRIGIEDDGGFLGVSMQQLDMIPGKGGSQRGHNISYAGIPERQEIEIAFHQHGITRPAHLFSGLAQPIEIPPLAKQRRFRRVQIFGVLLPQRPPAERNDSSGEIFNGKDHPTPKAVIKISPLTFREEPGLFRQRQGNLFQFQIILEMPPARQGISQVELLCRLGADPPLVQVLAGDPAFRSQQPVPIV